MNLSPMPRAWRTASFVILLTAAPAVAQNSVADDCFNARQDENKQHQDNLAEIRKREIDVDAEYRKELERCRNDRECRSAAVKKRSENMVPIRTARVDEDARHSKALVDIGRTRCVSDNRRSTKTAPRDSGAANEEILNSGDRARLFKLSAEIDDVARELDDSGNPGLEFAKGLADWASGTLKFLAQKPGEPLKQMAKAIADYLTNDNASNHKQMRAAAEQAVQEFQKNPARFIGQNLPNALPGPGALGKVPALRQLAQVEKAAERLKKLAAAERQFGNAYTKALQDGAKVGAKAPAKCFASNACFPIALAEAELYKMGGPAGTGQPWRIRGAKPWGAEDMAHTPDQVRARLKPYGDGFAPRRSGTYNPEQLDAIWEGNAIRMEGPDHIRRIMEREGVGSQGIVLIEFERLPTDAPDAVLGHALNVRNNGGRIEFVDKTLRGMEPTEYFPLVNKFFFFPLP
jgi:hypothetical protein